MTSKSSPPKPYEVRKTTAGNTLPISSSVARSAMEPTFDGNSGIPSERLDISGRNPHIGGGTANNGNNSTLSPRVPTRPSTTTGYGSSYGSNYGSNYGSSYGSYGSRYGMGSSYGSGYGSGYSSSPYYGSSYSRYGMGYGGYGGYGSSGYGSSYGSSYGSYGGYSGYGSSYGSNYPRVGGTYGNMVDGGYYHMNRFGSIVESFSRFSRLLDANFDALHGSFASVIRLLDVFGEFFYVIRTFAVFRLLFGGIGNFWKILTWLIGRNRRSQQSTSSEGLELGDYKQFQANERRKRSLPLFFVVMGVMAVALPLLFSRMWKAFLHIKRLHDEENPGALENIWGGEEQLEMVRAIHPFQGENQADLPFRQGEVIKIVGKPFPEWWEGEINGRRGMFPANFVEPLPREGNTPGPV